MLALPAKHGKRHCTRCFFLEIGGRYSLVQGTSREAIQRVSDPRQLVNHLVAYHRPLQDNGPSAAELQNAPCRNCNRKEHDRQELLIACNGDGTAEEMKYMIREQFFLPAGSHLYRRTPFCLVKP